MPFPFSCPVAVFSVQRRLRLHSKQASIHLDKTVSRINILKGSIAQANPELTRMIGYSPARHVDFITDRTMFVRSASA